MMNVAVVFVGAGLGGALRHSMNIWVARHLGSRFPFHTFSINILGSLVMGLIFGTFVGRHGVEPLPLFLMTGILGGFTTFSAFSLDTLVLWERTGRHLAVLYVAGSVLGGLAALALGLWIARLALA